MNRLTTMMMMTLLDEYFLEGVAGSLLIFSCNNQKHFLQEKQRPRCSFNCRTKLSVKCVSEESENFFQGLYQSCVSCAHLRQTILYLWDLGV